MLKQFLTRFASETLQLLLLGIKLKIVAKPTEFETLAVPRQIVHGGIRVVSGDPLIRRAFAQLKSIGKAEARRIYVSRSRLSDTEGAILCETYIEQNLQRESYTIIHPEIMPIRDQLAAYNGASELVFAEGSALHLYALIARPDQRVFIVWRREKVHAAFPWQIATFCGQATYGTPCVARIWVPRRDGTNLVRARASLNFVTLRAQMMETGFLSSGLWEIPSDAEIEEELARLRETCREPLI